MVYRRVVIKAKRILQDNCPLMNTVPVVNALTHIGAMRLKMLDRSPDINSIENVFHAMRIEIQHDVVKQGIQKETFLKFQKRARNIIQDVSVSYIYKAIDSICNRVDLVIKG